MRRGTMTALPSGVRIRYPTPPPPPLAGGGVRLSPAGFRADSRLKVHGFADNLFLLSRAVHSAILINHAAQVWYGDGTCDFTKRFLVVQ